MPIPVVNPRLVGHHPHAGRELKNVETIGDGDSPFRYVSATCVDNGEVIEVLAGEVVLYPDSARIDYTNVKRADLVLAVG